MKQTIYLDEQINFIPIPSIYLHTTILILKDSSLFIKVGASKLSLSNIFIAFCSIEYKPEGYITEPVRAKSLIQKFHSTNAYQSLVCPAW